VKGAFVVDASVTLKLLIEEPGTQEAKRFFGRLTEADPPLLYVPDLIYIECANIVWKYVSRHNYASGQAQKALETLTYLALEAYPTQHLFQEAFKLSCRHAISSYDACYLALAQRVPCPLVTEDAALIRKVRPHVSVPLYPLVEVV
jgi:predicted nucleic acid-binding protein